MPRRRVVQRREVLPDPKYNSVLVAKFINIIMKSGKKSVAEKIVYKAIDIIKQKMPDKDPLEVFTQAIENAKPLVHVKSRRVGGATYQVPVEILPHARTSIAMRWIRDFARARGEKTMQERLAAELIDCYNKVGATMKKREDTHKMAEANKAFIHFRY